MDITLARATDANYPYPTSQSVSTSGNNTGQNNSNVIPQVTEVWNIETKVEAKGNKPEQTLMLTNDEKNVQNFNRENLNSITKALNKFMESLNADIHFKLHDETKELMVQVVDDNNHKVLKEFPPHQLLDTIAAIRDRIGVLLDKRV